MHRIGRTGRAGKHGEAFSFFTSRCFHLANDLISVLLDTKQSVPMKLYDYEEQYLSCKDVKIFRRWAVTDGKELKFHARPSGVQEKKYELQIILKDMKAKEFVKISNFDNFLQSNSKK